MRTSARKHKSANRQLASSKRSIVMVCAGIAMILGTTSVGASLFGGDDDVLQREKAATRPLTGETSEADDENLSTETATPLNDQSILAPAPRTNSTTRKTEATNSEFGTAPANQTTTPGTEIPPVTTDPPIIPPVDLPTDPIIDPTSPQGNQSTNSNTAPAADESGLQ